MLSLLRAQGSIPGWEVKIPQVMQNGYLLSKKELGVAG